MIHSSFRMIARARGSLYMRQTSTTATGVEILGGHSKATFIDITEKISPFVKDVLGLKVLELRPGYLKMTMEMKPIFVGNPKSKVLHGGVLAAALDHVGGFAAWSNLTDPLAIVSTVDLRIDYLSPAPYEKLQVIGQMISQKKKLIRADIEIQTMNGDVIAVARGLYNIYNMKSSEKKNSPSS